MSDSGDQPPYGQPNNPDPYGDAPQTNPYGSASPPPSPTPPPANPYGAPAYSAPGMPGQPGPAYGAPAYGVPVKTDGLAIAALVSSLLGCLCGLPFVAGIILGIIALGRTKDGKAKGRGMAIAGILIGAVGIVLAIVGIVLLFVVGINQIVTPSNAKVGQCVDVTTTGSKISMVKKSCSDTHDAEIVGVAKVTGDNLADARRQDFCREVVDPAALDRLAHVAGLQYESLTEEPDNIQIGDHVVCYVRGTSKLRTDVLH